MGGPGDLDLLTGGVRRVVPVEHDLFVGVLVVDHQELPVPAVQIEKRHVVAVVTELLGLCGGALAAGVEAGCAGQQRVAPADHDLLGEAFGHGDGIGGVRSDRLEVQAAGRAGRRRGA